MDILDETPPVQEVEGKEKTAFEGADAKNVSFSYGAETFKMQPVQEYSKDYNECIAQAQADQRRNARPELKAYPESLDAYDTVYLGYPNYSALP